MKKQDEIVSLIQTLGTSFRVQPEKTEERLGALSEVQQENLLRLLKRIAQGPSGGYAFGQEPPELQHRKAHNRVIWE